MIWFTADTHFGHRNIIKYCSRPFKDVDEMDNEMIKRWNACVQPNDTIYHLGDFCLKKRLVTNYLTLLHGKIIRLRGSHDEGDLPYMIELSMPEAHVTLCHYRMMEWPMSYHGTWHLYGHSHGRLSHLDDGFCKDVGVDTNNFYPYSWAQLRNGLRDHSCYADIAAMGVTNEM